MSMRRPVFAAFADGVGDDVQPEASVTTTAAAALMAQAPRRPTHRLCSLACPGNVEHNLEFQQGRTRRHGIGFMSGVRVNGGPIRPGLKSFFGLPLRHHEVAVFTLDRTQQLEAEKTRGILHRVGPVCETLFQLGASVGGHLDCVDFHHWHAD